MLLVALPALADVSAPGGGAANPRRQVLTAAEAKDCVPSLQPAEYFTPAAKEIERLERALPGWLGTVGGKQSGAMKRVRERLATDHIWYFGQLEKGRRVIEIRGYCEQLVQGHDRCFPLVKDGGDWIWYLRWDIARGTFEGFYTNGEA